MKTAIRVRNVSKTFKLPHERHSSIKSALINRLRGGGRTYEKQEVLKNVSLEINKGDFYAIVGRNGSGKSTLLKLLAGIYTPTEGSIQINGKLTPFIELGVGFNQELSGRENVFLNGALLGFNREEMKLMYPDIVAFAELERFMDQKLKNYSSGMQVRLAFSIAIRAQSDILLLDEVLAVGDAAFQQKCFNYFEELKRNKKTVVFVSHDMGAVRRFCNKAAYIKNGMLIREGAASDIADLYTLENIEDPANALQTGPKLPSTFKISSKISKQTEGNVTLEVSYSSQKKDQQTYVGIALINNGASIAEIITSTDKPLKGNGKVVYNLDTSMLNSGVYYLAAALFKLENRELIAYEKKKNQFMIKGHDITRGAALKLKDTWKY